jgi:hypothetical protein
MDKFKFIFSSNIFNLFNLFNLFRFINNDSFLHIIYMTNKKFFHKSYKMIYFNPNQKSFNLSNKIQSI